MKLAIARLLDEDEGQGLTEYALILALIAIVAIVALNFLGGKVTRPVDGRQQPQHLSSELRLTTCDS